MGNTTYSAPLVLTADQEREESDCMVKRVLAGVFGAVLFGIAVPVLSVLLVGVPESLMGFVWLAVIGVVIGVVIGAIIGALFPRVFGFVFELFMGV